ncbi:MAG TPA: ATP-binding protein [Candidatus Omnitrophota bacterium]|nr:ATP-binding protein [Candidatus Omnitrophota bacterium]
MPLTSSIGLINAIASVALALFVFSRNPSGKTHRAYLFFGLGVGLYSIGYFFWGMSTTDGSALFAFKILTVGIVAINSGYLEFVFNLLNVREKKKWFLRSTHALNGLSVLAVCFELFFSTVERKNIWGYWPDPKPLFYIYFVLWFCQMGYGLLEVRNGYLQASGRRAVQLRYVFYSTLIGYVGGGTNWLPWFGINFPPYLNALVAVYVGILAYAIVRYNLMEIRIATARTGIFVFVYCIVLGIPAVLVSQGRDILENYLGVNWWFLPAGLFAILSFSGPFFYLILQRKAEAVLLKEQRAYQQTLLQASRGMTLVKDMDKLLKLIVHILTKTVKITHARIFLWDPDRKRYESRAVRGVSRQGGVGVVDEDSELVRRLREGKQALVLEELQSQSLASETIIKEMIAHGAALIIPSFIQDRLLGFLVLGEKKSKQLYTESDLDILKTLANQAALAIENCIFLTEFEHQQAHFFQAAKMADLGTMASGIAHQVNNRFNVIKLGAESALMVDFPRIEKQMAANNLEGIRPLIGSLESVYRKIAKNADHGGEIVRRLLDFSRLSEGFGPVNIGDVVASCVRLWECKHPVYDTDLRIEIPDGLARIHGNSGEIEEVLFNLLDNAYDAIKMKEEAWECGKLEKPEHPAKGRITLSAREALRHGRRYVEVTIADSGLGMPEEVRKQVFVPFFTTKATAIKGTGLGLYVIRKMVDAHQGEIELESVYGEGTTFRIFLPATGET